MLIEFSYYDISTSENELKDIVKDTLKYRVNYMSVLPQYVRTAKSIVSSETKISCPIDYPLGLFDTKSRLSAIELCIKSGINCIEVVCPSYFLCNRKYYKFRDDIKSVVGLCADKNVEVRYFLEYRVYKYELLYKIAQILLGLGVSTVMPSTGYLLDDINDNILASGLINKKVPKINIVCNGNVWLDQQVKVIKKANLYGIRVNSINALELLDKNNE